MTTHSIVSCRYCSKSQSRRIRAMSSRRGSNTAHLPSKRKTRDRNPLPPVRADRQDRPCTTLLPDVHPRRRTNMFSRHQRHRKRDAADLNFLSAPTHDRRRQKKRLLSSPKAYTARKTCELECATVRPFGPPRTPHRPPLSTLIPTHSQKEPTDLPTRTSVPTALPTRRLRFLTTPTHYQKRCAGLDSRLCQTGSGYPTDRLDRQGGCTRRGDRRVLSADVMDGVLGLL